MPRMSYKSALPKDIGTKIYKTGQTRGADDDQVFQNRVLRNNTVLIPYSVWELYRRLPDNHFEKGYIVLVPPTDYFSEDPPERSAEFAPELEIGQNALIFYETRVEWNMFKPSNYGWTFATSREPEQGQNPPLGGHYVARVPNTTSSSDDVIREGFTGADSGGKGAGIRVYEYTSRDELEKTRYQLAFLTWHTEGIDRLVQAEGATEDEIRAAKRHVQQFCDEYGLADLAKLERKRFMTDGQTICPLCLDPIKAIDLGSRMSQMEGRDVADLTVTEANLFHIEPVRPGHFNHCTYNLGWGHHHCNVVMKDDSIPEALAWMEQVLENNAARETGEGG